MMKVSIRHWLSVRIRLLCVAVFVAGSLLPPYVPKGALAQGGEGAEVDNTQFLLVEDGFLMKSSSLTQQGARRAYAQGLIHVAKSGDSIQSIADRYNITPETVMWANDLEAGAAIKSGQELIILPVNGVIHTVSRGQTLVSIADMYDIPVEEISLQNDITGGFILAGQELIVPNGKPIVVAPPVQVAVETPPAEERPNPAQESVKPPAAAPPAREEPASPAAVVAAAVPTDGILQMPCGDCFYTQYFHPGHYAVDIQERGGGPIYAAEGGTVIRADTGWNGGYGNVIEVDHGNGLVTLYAHNKELYVEEGDTVERGQNIAWMGNTGRVYGATGIHTHFEVRVKGVKKNPLLYLQ